MRQQGNFPAVWRAAQVLKDIAGWGAPVYAVALTIKS
jgi:hypothetical protein